VHRVLVTSEWVPSTGKLDERGRRGKTLRRSRRRTVEVMGEEVETRQTSESGSRAMVSCRTAQQAVLCRWSDGFKIKRRVAPLFRLPHSLDSLRRQLEHSQLTQNPLRITPLVPALQIHFPLLPLASSSPSTSLSLNTLHVRL
jgi:hypothetical protein